LRALDAVLPVDQAVPAKRGQHLRDCACRPAERARQFAYRRASGWRHEESGGNFQACAATQRIPALITPRDRLHVCVDHDTVRAQREVTAQVVVSGAMAEEQLARGLGHSVAHDQQHRIGGSRRFCEQPLGNMVGHQRATLDQHLSPDRLDHQIDPMVGHTDGLPGRDPDLCEGIDHESLTVHNANDDSCSVFGKYRTPNSGVLDSGRSCRHAPIVVSSRL
jgi:hypothetical protein